MPLHLQILNLGKQSDNNNVIVKIIWYLLDKKGFKKSDRSDFLGKDIINIKKRNLDKVSKKHLKEITIKAISACLDGKELTSRKIFRRII